MFSALFDSLFSSAAPFDCEAPGVHAGENPSSQSDTPSDIISDPEQAKEHKQQLGDKIEQADGAAAAPADDDDEEEEEEVPDVRARTLSSLQSRGATHLGPRCTLSARRADPGG